MKESLGVVQGPGNWKVVSVKKKDRSFAAVESGSNAQTYPQSPDSGPVRCCDVVNLCQAFSQPTGPGRLWISLSAVVLQRSSWYRGLCGAFLSAAFPGLLKFLITGLEDGLVTTKQFILRGDVTDSGVQAHCIVMVNKVATHP